jgi:hypothetical protein
VSVFGSALPIEVDSELIPRLPRSVLFQIRR